MDLDTTVLLERDIESLAHLPFTVDEESEVGGGPGRSQLKLIGQLFHRFSGSGTGEILHS